MREKWIIIMNHYKQHITVVLCYFKHSMGEPCENKVQWAIKTDKGNMFKVCDLHLAWSLRFSGIPARVDGFVLPDDIDDNEPTVKIIMR